MPSPTFSTSIQEPPGPSAKLILPTQTPNTNPTVFNDGMIIRQRVFIDEQKCTAEAEIDSDDSRSWHWVLYDTSTSTSSSSSTSKPRPVGVIRLVPPPQTPHSELLAETPHTQGAESIAEGQHSPAEPCIKLTRVAIMPEYRGLGLGRRLVETALGWAAVHGVEIAAAIAARGAVGGWRGLVLVHAQVDVERMYVGLGFVTDEGLGRWDEEGIEHVGMFRRIVVE